MSVNIFKDVTLRRKEILERVNPKNVEMAQGYLKYVNISNFEKSTGEWCAQLGEIINVPNLRHLDFRHTAIRRFLSKSGSAGMTSVIMNCPRLSNRASRFIVEENNNDLLQEYKDLCKI